MSETTASTTRQFTPAQLRDERESLGLSRHDVEDHTGLASSVVWRAEQSTRKITDEQYALIAEFFRQVKAMGKPAYCGKKIKKISASVDSQILHQRLTAAQAKIKDLEAALAEANAKADLLGANCAGLHATGVKLQEELDELRQSMKVTDGPEVLSDLTKLVETKLAEAKAKKASTAALKDILAFINR